MSKRFESILQSHTEAVEKSLDAEGLTLLDMIKSQIVSALRAGNKLLLCGNGGSAADCQHIAAEFVGRFKMERKGLPAIALTTDSSTLTCLANDYSFEIVFSRQVEALGQKGDVLIAISTSGNSANILKAAEAAKEKGILVIAFTGKDGGKLKGLADISFVTKSDITSHIQEVHEIALHAISEVAEEELAT